MKNLKAFRGSSAPSDYTIICRHITLLFEAVIPGDVVLYFSLLLLLLLLLPDTNISSQNFDMLANYLLRMYLGWVRPKNNLNPLCKRFFQTLVTPAVYKFPRHRLHNNLCTTFGLRTSVVLKLKMLSPEFPFRQMAFCQ